MAVQAEIKTVLAREPRDDTTATLPFELDEIPGDRVASGAAKPDAERHAGELVRTRRPEVCRRDLSKSARTSKPALS